MEATTNYDELKTIINQSSSSEDDNDDEDDEVIEKITRSAKMRLNLTTTLVSLMIMKATLASAKMNLIQAVWVNLYLKILYFVNDISTSGILLEHVLLFNLLLRLCLQDMNQDLLKFFIK